MKKIKISAVSYFNTVPFIYGIKNSPRLLDKIELSTDIPSECARKLAANEVDIGLIPVAAIPQIEGPHIITDFCIGAEGKVDSVMLYSEVPLNEIKVILLDYQSRTSIRLCRLLCEKFWKIDVEFISAEPGFESKIGGREAGVVIGDRTFNMCNKYNYCYDLAEEWQKWTGFPFVFAAWVSNKALPIDFLVEFGRALKKGVENIEKAVAYDSSNLMSEDQKIEYLSKRISYALDNRKKKALNLFLEHIRK